MERARDGARLSTSPQLSATHAIATFGVWLSAQYKTARIGYAQSRLSRLLVSHLVPLGTPVLK